MQTLPLIVALACYAPGTVAQISESLSTAFDIPSTVIASSVTSAPPISSATSTSTPSSPAGFPPIGALPRDYSPAGLDELWDIVGPVEAPPFTTTRVPSAAVTLPSSPPALYPSFYAPEPKDILPDLKFPPGFLFGVATAAFQVEGAVKDEGKGPSMWDYGLRLPGLSVDNTTGDIADLQYYLYKEDVDRVAALGVNAHSFSISWTRIFPFGAADSPVNAAGIDHYSDVIDYHLERGVAPVVTLFHWDTPIALEAYYGGFHSPQIIDDFINYAVTVFKAYNGRVKTWYTFNEPAVFCGEMLATAFNGAFPPGVNATSAPYQCAYHLLKAHAGAVKAFRAMNISGEIAFKNDNFIGIPWRTNTTDDALAVERHTAFQIGIFSDPVYTTGDWPQILKDTLPESLLPRFTEEESTDILGSADFFAIDPYRVQYVRAPEGGIDACVADTMNPLWPLCNQVVEYDSGYGWAAGVSADPVSSWLQATPVAFRTFMAQVHARWPASKIYVSEYGFTEPNEGELTEVFRIKEDVARTNYYMTYLGEMLLSIHEDGVPLAGAFAWSMLDNLEWTSGLRTRFGIQYVNYTTLERTYKCSALSLSEFFAAHTSD